MGNPSALSLLRRSPIFARLPELLLARIEPLCRNHSYRQGDTLFAQGTPGDKLFGILSGRLMISAGSPNGSQVLLNVVGQGEIVGEIAFLDGGLRTASGRAASPINCFTIDRTAFFNLLQQFPQLSIHLMQLLCQRVRWMTKLVADSAFLSVPERMAARLRDLAQPCGTDENQVEVRISQAELAQFLGVSRQVVNGYLRGWAKSGRIALARGTIRVHNLSTLTSPAV